VKAVQAGVDQFGGTEDAPQLVEAVRAGELAESRLDASVRRIMQQKIELGLFENPFVDPEQASRTVGTDAFRAEGLDAQRRSLVLLENDRAMLPLKPVVANGTLRVYAVGIDTGAVRRAGWSVAADPAQADVAIVRLEAPFETLHPQYMFGSMQHEGNLAFRDGVKGYDEFVKVSAQLPTVVSVYLDRPAILTALRGKARAIVANFGVSDEALLDVLAGKASPQGKLPFDLPASMESVAAQKPDVAHDVPRPLYPFGTGKRY
jgi:beta-glucosidase